jgi:hypothetical protein
MTIVSFRLDEIPPATPEELSAMKALSEMPHSEIVFDEDVPEMTEEQLAGFRPWDEVMAER